MFQPIHPFPARMAPEIALEQVERLPPGSRVLDPFAGSGTVLRAAVERDHRAIGFDLDPLAVLMARVWTTPLDPDALRTRAGEVAALAARGGFDVALPWIDTDPATRDFVEYWFAEPQRAALRALAATLCQETGPVGDALRIALSRIIITKDHGASRARDVSHSRPHRVWHENAFPVLPSFLRSVKRLAERLAAPSSTRARVELGDARSMDRVESASIDAVITSPPYLNAIDYLRGHRLALVWLGYRLDDLRRIRGVSVGAERGPDPNADLERARGLTAWLEPLDGLPSAERRMVDRYVLDLDAATAEIARVLRPGGKAVVVVGNSHVRGVFVHNARVVKEIARQHHLAVESESERDLPPNRRYLPPPRDPVPSEVEKRLRSETVLKFVRVGVNG